MFNQVDKRDKIFDCESLSGILRRVKKKGDFFNPES